MKKLKGEISINRVYGNDTDEIRISIGDVDASVEIIEATLSLENFAKVIMNQSCIKCDIRLNDDSSIGKRYEHKEEIVLIPKKYKSYYPDELEKEKASREILKLYEKDGWTGRSSDLWNHHKWVKGTKKDENINMLFSIGG